MALTSRDFKKSIAFDLSTLLFTISAIWLVANRLTPGAPDSFTKQPYMAPLYAILMAAVLVSASMSTQISKILDNKLFRWIAKLSFSIYLWHMFLIVIIERRILDNYVYYGLTDAWQWILISSIVLLISIAIAEISWRFIESPVLHFARNRRRAAL